MKDAGNIHQKVQEHCDCFMANDPLKEMSRIPSDKDADEAAVKWLALAALHGINSGAKEITISRDSAGETQVTATYRPATLPSPGSDIGAKVIETVREMTHIEESGQLPFSLGVRNSSIDLAIEVEKEGDQDLVKIKFPE